MRGINFKLYDTESIKDALYNYDMYGKVPEGVQEFLIGQSTTEYNMYSGENETNYNAHPLESVDIKRINNERYEYFLNKAKSYIKKFDKNIDISKLSSDEIFELEKTLETQYVTNIIDVWELLFNVNFSNKINIIDNIPLEEIDKYKDDIVSIINRLYEFKTGQRPFDECLINWGDVSKNPEAYNKFIKQEKDKSKIFVTSHFYEINNYSFLNHNSDSNMLPQD